MMQMIVGGVPFEEDIIIPDGTDGTDGISLPSGKMFLVRSCGASTEHTRVPVRSYASLSPQS